MGGLAQPWVSPTGHPFVSPTGHQSCRGTTDPETLRRHTLKAGAALAGCAAIRPVAAPPAITVTVDATFIRSREDGERHFQVRVGNVETQAGGRHVFGGVAKTETDIEGLIRKNLDVVGGNRDTVLRPSPTVVPAFGAFSPVLAFWNRRFWTGSTSR
jgi:hypothetical protein